MTTAVAHQPHTAPHSLSNDSHAPTRTASPLRYAPAAAPRMSQPNSAAGTPAGSANATPTIPASRQPPARSSPQNGRSPDQAARSPPSAKPSPPSANSRSGPKIRVKKEPPSPTAPTSRPRPRRLDLSSSNSASRGPQTAGASLASRESAGLAIKDLGVACLSPGFQTQDPAVREQLQRSLDVREQQRQLIEARQKGTTKSIALQDVAAADAGPSNGLGARKRGPPPGLSIHAPAAAAFANERVVQSAPLGQSFTGLHQHNSHGPPRSIAPSAHAGHPPPPPPSNRLPPISDVFASERGEAPVSAGFRPAPQPPLPSPGHAPPPAYSPGYPPSQYPPPHHDHHPAHRYPEHGHRPDEGRPREYRSAEEAVHNMTGGREDLQPKIVHYGGVQPPTPPSPGATHRDFSGPHAHYPPHHQPPHSAQPYGPPPFARRRTRDEYEQGQGHDSPPREYKRVREEDDWRREMNQREKREEFLRLCERAWDLFHS